MKIVLVAINAKYIHSNLAIRYLKSYAKDYSDNIVLKEFTINHYVDNILQALYKEQPDFIGISCYIWNISMVRELCIELKKVLPNTMIWLGGPEVSFDGREYLESNKNVDGIMIGEGEESFRELLDYYVKGQGTLTDIRGIVFRTSAHKDGDKNKDNTNRPLLDNKDIITYTPIRAELDFSTIPFAYDDMKELDNKIIYYETSRGCPYSCSYCLSSTDKKVRLRNTQLVKEELIVFLKAKVPQVKFVDRTFNCNRPHTLAIWEFIKEHDNGITNFHFEISADILNDEEIKLLHSMREGLVQLEIGVQSTNDVTIDAIHRKMSFEKIKGVVTRIQEGRNVHQHLDLIAGLPHEDYNSFKDSFNNVYSLKPDQFQLGFLKVLKGSAMYYDSVNYGIVYKDEPPYEVLYTNWLSYMEILQLKGIEDMVEVYYNSGQFAYAIKYMEHFFNTPFDLYEELARYYEEQGLNELSHSRIKRYEILIDFMKEQYYYKNNKRVDVKAFCDILVHDLYIRENLKSRPSFACEQDNYKTLFRDFYYDDKLYDYLMVNKEDYKLAHLKQYLHIEHYNIDVVETAQNGVTIQEDRFVLYDYMHRNPLNYDANIRYITF